MIISSQFNRLFWGTIIADIKQNLKHPIELQHKVFGHIKVDMSKLSRDSIHQLLKQLTNFPKDEKGIAKSWTEVTNEEALKHIELIKLMMNMNGFTFKADEEEWQRLIDSVK
jgi:hypothetical protein